MVKSQVLLSLAMLMAGQIGAQDRLPDRARLAGGPCEGCEAVFEYGTKQLFPVDTLPDFRDKGPKIKVSGTIYQPDGRTPAPGVILYIYHTDQQGRYATRGDETGWGRRHGYIRGWVQTDSTGRYAFCTLRPEIYPNRTAPSHIHATILEPDGTYYWIGSYHFEDDPLLTARERSPKTPRGGSSGLLSLRREGDLLVGERDIILGRHVPGYPRK